MRAATEIYRKCRIYSFATGQFLITNKTFFRITSCFLVCSIKEI